MAALRRSGFSCGLAAMTRCICGTTPTPTPTGSTAIRPVHSPTRSATSFEFEHAVVSCRVLRLPARSQEVLAAAGLRRHGSFRRPNRADQGLRRRAFHLHFVLTSYARPRAFRLLSRQRRGSRRRRLRRRGGARRALHAQEIRSWLPAAGGRLLPARCWYRTR